VIDIKVLAIDVDGTLVNSRNELPEENLRALHRAHEAGLKICICTGRSLVETQSVIERIGLDLDYGVFVFGSIVSRLPEGTTLVRTLMDPALADRLVAFFREMGYPVLLLYDPTQARIDYRYVAGQRHREWYDRWLALAPPTLERLDAWAPLAASPVRIGVITSPDEIEDVLRRLRDTVEPELLNYNAIHAPNYGVHVVECFAPKVNKWYGLMQLAERFGVTGEQIAAIGDDVNDLAMIRNAGLGIAMGNAVESIKNLADWQVATQDEAGVAEAIDRILARKTRE
jgi:hypothetical protein